MAEIRKVGLIVLHGERVLLCRKRGSQQLILPGGKPEPGETAIETLQRELREELDQVTLHDAVWLGAYLALTAAETGAPAKTIEIEIFAGRLEGEPVASREIEELIWFGPEDPREHLAPSLQRQIFPDLIARRILPWRE